MTPEQLLAAARALVDRPAEELVGLWPRAAALAARRALEDALDELWAVRAPGLERASARAQLLCLHTFLRPPALAGEVAFTWAALSAACHHHAYDVGPTAEELRGRFDVVERLLERVAAARTSMPPAVAGAALCLVSAAGFGAMAIFGKLAYDAGVGTLTLLLVRFVLGAAIFAAVLAASRTRPVLPRRAVVIGLALGAIGYATQAGLFFGALRRLDASLLALLLYTYPAWVTLVGFAIGRERPTGRRLVALGLSSAGLVIVLATAATGAFDAAGAAMGIGAALAYTAYILVADGAGVSHTPLALSLLVCVGASVTFAVVGGAAGTLDFGFDAEGWLWLALIAVVSTALPIVAFFAGMARVGPSTASILSTFEPVVTVTLAYLAFHEHLSGAQLAGAALVLAAAVLLATPARTPNVAEPAL